MSLAQKYPGRVPIKLQRHVGCAPHVALDRSKYLVPMNMRWLEFATVLRKRMTVEPHEAVFYYLPTNRLVPADEEMCSLHAAHKSPDECLHVTYSTENAFG